MDPQYDQLIEPSRVAFTFGAPGWDVLGGVVLLVMGGVIWVFIRHYRKNRYRREALAMLARMEDLYSVNMLLKRVAMGILPREEVAGLRGGEWIEFLNTMRRRRLFDERDERLVSGLYGPAEGAGEGFRGKAHEWIKKHHRAI